ncbi:MAG: 5'/3'-nucleotidase SurE [Clostridia bacterium]|nr:5'/3'-nucleotidase SurE [Clostridia bacterium]
MKILITNDDGIKAEGINVLANWASRYGEVTIVAPKTGQSGKSQAINLGVPIEIKKVDFDATVKAAYSVDATPADCIRVAYDMFWDNYDLVLSGINRGLNVGADIVYSGTAGAIFEASYINTKAIAVSTVPDTFDGPKKYLDEVYEYFVSNKLLEYNMLYNVNIPAESKGIVITKQGGPYYRDHFAKIGNNMYTAEGYSNYKGTKNLNEDLDAIMCGYTTITPLTVSRTDMSVYNKLKTIIK